MTGSFWKLYLFQKVFFTNPFFNYASFFDAVDPVKSRLDPRPLYLHIYGIKILRDATKICRNLEIEPFLLFGTLLGHHRDGGFIAHDRDIDLGLLERDFRKIGQLKEEMEKKGYSIRREGQTGVVFKAPRKYRRLTIDFYMVHEKDGETAIPTSVSKLLGDCRYPPEVFSEFEKIMFLDAVEILAPTRTEQYLTLTYGDWQTPNCDFDYTRDYANVKAGERENETL
jgi:phosphorylcholine metabolism protein LicD